MSVDIHIGDALEHGYGLLRLPRMTSDEFWDFCQDNPTLQVERNAEGDIILMAPSDGWTESRNIALAVQLYKWDESLVNPGIVFGSSAGFTMPNGAERSPDLSWVARDHWNSVAPELRRRFPHISPDFVVEVMSPSDRLKDARTKMDEYLANGVRLGWLIDRKNRTVYVYRPGEAITELVSPSTLSGSPELPGFVADLEQVFLPDAGE
ncbi:MAG: Uma2 family endonuclease [Armatimonadota bacterium]